MPAFRSLRRKPAKLTLGTAAATIVAAVTVTSAVAIVAPNILTSQTATFLPPARPGTSGAGSAAGVPAANPGAELGRDKTRLATLMARRLIRADRLAARRAAQRRAARRATARQAAAQPAAAPVAGGSANVSAVPAGAAQQIAAAMLGSFGWPSSQFGCLQSLWNHESGWNVYASNPVTGAYGIPQATPGSKMASAGPNWQSSPTTQIRWGLGYIKATYGSPCAAWSHEQATGWY